MSQMYTSIESVMQMIEYSCTVGNIKQALADLKVIPGISDYQYRNTKELLEGILRDKM